MLAYQISDLILIAFMATCGAGIVVLLARRAGAKVETTPRPSFTCPPTFLFDGDDLIDATPEARLLIAGAPCAMTRRQAVVHQFSQQFPTLETDMSTLDRDETRRVSPSDDSGHWIMLHDIAGHIRVTLHTPHDDIGETGTSQIVFDAMTKELGFLRKVADLTPQQIWQQDANGQLIWANQAYLRVSDDLYDSEESDVHFWPARPVFDDLHFDVPPTKAIQRRVSVRFPEKRADDWFDVTSQQESDTTLHFASDANAAVQAEQSRKTLMQTVSRAFAHLSIGLAIFDQKRQLTIFNPALHDLTGMVTEFLTARPTLDMFLDNLREARMLPEPKNYTSWRDQFIAVEAAARAGNYSEIWNLPSGLTYRVTGKPYADGAFAFFFEDISAEVALTRRFRSDIETGQHVLDTMTDAVAVFSSGGTLVMSNKAYGTLWGAYDADLIAQEDIRTEIEAWSRKCAASPIWSDLLAYVGTLGDREQWSDTAVLDDGRRLSCEAKPLPNNQTLVTFQLSQKVSPTIQVLTRHDPALMVGKR